MRRPTAPLAALAALTLLPSDPLAQTVWVVDPNGGGDFTQISTAVNAASSGDTVLVKTGLYSGFSVFGKSLVVTEDTGAAVVCTDLVTVSNVPAGERAVLFGITVLTTDGSLPFRMEHNDGSVWLQSCGFSQSSDNPFVFAGNPGGIIDDCVEVVLIDTSFISKGDLFGIMPGWHGLVATDSKISAYGLTAEGSFGAAAESLSGLPGETGRDGVNVTGGFLFLSDAEATGGAGGAGAAAFFGQPCTDGGEGGAGVRGSGGAVIQVLDSALTGGPGGPPGDAGALPPCNPGAAGPGAAVAGGTLDFLPGVARAFSVTTNPVREGGTTSAVFGGLPGELAFLLVSPLPACGYDAGLRGTLLTGQPLFIFSLGQLDGAGTLTVPFTVKPFNNASDEVVGVYEQGVLFDIAQGFTLAPGAFVVHLDQQF